MEAQKFRFREEVSACKCRLIGIASVSNTREGAIVNQRVRVLKAMTADSKRKDHAASPATMTEGKPHGDYRSTHDSAPEHGRLAAEDAA